MYLHTTLCKAPMHGYLPPSVISSSLCTIHIGAQERSDGVLGLLVARVSAVLQVDITKYHKCFSYEKDLQKTARQTEVDVTDWIKTLACIFFVVLHQALFNRIKVP